MLVNMFSMEDYNINQKYRYCLEEEYAETKARAQKPLSGYIGKEKSIHFDDKKNLLFFIASDWFL